MKVDNEWIMNDYGFCYCLVIIVNREIKFRLKYVGMELVRKNFKVFYYFNF